MRFREGKAAIFRTPQSASISTLHHHALLVPGMRFLRAGIYCAGGVRRHAATDAIHVLQRHLASNVGRTI